MGGQVLREISKMILIRCCKCCAVHQVLFQREERDMGYQEAEASVRAVSLQNSTLQSQHSRVSFKRFKGSHKGHDKDVEKEVTRIGRQISAQSWKNFLLLVKKVGRAILKGEPLPSSLKHRMNKIASHMGTRIVSPSNFESPWLFFTATLYLMSFDHLLLALYWQRFP